MDDYLENKGIVRMAWPAYLPNHNPTENIWDALGYAVLSCFLPQATLSELKSALQEEWWFLNSAMVDHQIESMVTKCKLLYIGGGGGGGGHIPY